MTHAIEMHRVRKTFGDKVAVEGIDLAVPAGSMHGFIGPNGAGKSTTIRMIMSILFPDSGDLSVLGKKSAVESKDKIGYLPEERGVYKKMKVAAFLRYMGRLKGLDAGSGLNTRVGEWLEKVSLPDVANKKCEELSKGMQQKVQFIAAVLHDPQLVILDEPFSGLDPVNMRLLRDLIGELREQGKTVIFSTHVMAQAEQLCEHVVMIHQGRKVLDDTVDAVRGRHSPNRVVFAPLDASAWDQTEASVRALPMIESTERRDGMGDLAADAWLVEGADAGDAVAAIAQAAPMARIEVHRPSLEDVFIEIVTGSSDADEQEVRDMLSGSADNQEVAS